MSIVTRYLHLKTVEWLTALFFTGVALAIIAKLGYDYGPYGKNPDVIRPWLWSFVMALGVFTILAALYSDWVLGAITENLEYQCLAGSSSSSSI
ncbi:hypothetical protein AX16_001647 [Volvariella volvacea WC 439]|nr:hypothetical protein AX16_001647 [Volvariella volvacea WC 439]